MFNYKDIEELYAYKHKVPLSKGNKDIGDFYVEGVAYNVKSNNLKRKNFMPRIVSADKLYNYLQEPKNNLMIVFVDHKDTVIIRDEYVKIENISWDCLSIQCQGLGLLMMNDKLKIDIKQTREQFLNKLVYEYKHNYIPKERIKLDFLEEKYV
tara:strand:- start:40 stop:498 length:459 start_codon:yes stop_codon:yes gene_type:complete